MTYWPMSAWVGNLRNNDQSLIEPLASPEEFWRIRLFQDEAPEPVREKL
jgi:hypothetical protein